MGIGTPRQFVSVLISTTANQPWAVLSTWCRNLTSAPLATCAKKRGGILSPANSTSWNYTGLYTLESEANLGINASAKFARETVQLGVDGSRAGSFSLANQTVAGIFNPDFWIATWGIRPDTTNITTLENRSPSLLSNLKTMGKISSLSWGYTAGATYRYGTHKTAAVSLTLGGTDISRYEPHNTSFDMVMDPSRDLVVGVRSVKTNITEKSLVPTPFLSLLDAGVSHLWLPKDACQAFETAFNLTYNDTLGLYPINDTLHQVLLAQNPSITFTLGNDLSPSNSTVDITLPYASFDLLLTTDYPGISQPTRYFPLRRAANASQYTLGRTFFQEAYVVADYERYKFSIHQTVFPGVDNETLVAIAANPGANNNGTLSTAAAAGVAIGIIVVVVLLLAIAYRFRRKVIYSFYQISPFHVNMPPEKSTQEDPGCKVCFEAPGSSPFPLEAAGRERQAELDNNGRYELPNGSLNANELETSSITSTSTVNTEEIFELPGSDCSTLADRGDFDHSKEVEETTGAKTWLCKDYVNQDYAVQDNSASARITLCAEGEIKSNEVNKAPAADSATDASNHSRSRLSLSTEDNEKEGIQRISPCDSPMSSEHEWRPIEVDNLRFASPPPMIEDEQAIPKQIDAILGTRASIASNHALDFCQEHREIPDSKGSLQSSNSMVSDLSSGPSVTQSGRGSAGLLTLNILPHAARKDSIVSPL